MATNRIEIYIGITCVMLFVLGVSYIIYSSRPVVALRSARDTNQYTAQYSAVSSAGDGQVVSKPQTSPPAGESSKGPLTFTMADVAAHTDASNCWSLINGSVYDLSSWVNRHPGGSRSIKRLCGSDGSASFSREHGRSRSTQRTLALFKIGILE